MNVAVIVLLRAGMVSMVAAAAGSAKEPMSPIQTSKTLPGGMMAVTGTSVPAGYELPPVPLITVRV